MATASTESKRGSKKTPQEDEDHLWEDVDETDEEDDDGMCDKIMLCNLHGVRDEPFYRNWTASVRSKRTYFLLPDEPIRFQLIEDDVTSGKIKARPTDFEKFWYSLSDSHKERRLLANYMVLFNDIRTMDAGRNARDKKTILHVGSCAVTQLIRRQFLEPNKATFRKETMPLFEYANRTDTLMQLSSGIATRALLAPIDRIEKLRESEKTKLELAGHLNDLTRPLLISFTFDGLVRTYFAWVSLDVTNLQTYLGTKTKLMEMGAPMNQADFMRKLSLAAPRWCKSDRAIMLRAIETKGGSCPGTYVDYLLQTVGVEKFKNLVFGKHRFCSHCRRSSYIGEDRLLACKRCDTEGVRPRAWYCDKKCQRADWIQHKKAKHQSKEKKPSAKSTTLVNVGVWRMPDGRLVSMKF